ncbi:MAG TPA: acyl carrier protein [Polyangiaceae bacterium]|nr:acyl carrier protein [Polyangiaceae bacterium]
MKDQLFQSIRQLLSDKLDVEEERVSQQSSLVDDLGADSLDLVQLALDVEERFGVEFSERDILALKTVGDVLSYISVRLDARGSPQPALADP